MSDSDQQNASNIPLRQVLSKRTAVKDLGIGGLSYRQLSGYKH
jgi:hypothetical protein